MSIARDLARLRTPVQVTLGGTGNTGTLNSIASNVNWDTLTTPGTFFIPSANGANVPVGGGVNYVVEVINTPNGLKQNATLYGTPQTYSRSVASGVWQRWYKTFDNNSIIGPVTQASGLPTGAIIERGNNSQGSYVRYADGTQICWITVSTGAAVNLAHAGGAFYGSPAIYPLTYPAPFISVPTVTASASLFGSTTGVVWVAGYEQPEVNGWGGWLALSTVATGSYANIRLIAVGRWF